MKDLKVGENRHVIRLERGELVMASIREWGEGQSVRSAFFYGLGAVCEFTMAYYDLVLKKYVNRVIEESHELTNITGNLSWIDNQLVVHAHGSLAGEDYELIGGHLVEAKVSGAVEVLMESLGVRIERHRDEELGLNLMSLG